MKEARTIGLPAYSIPAEWLPVRVGQDQRGPWADWQCGWWLCENEHAAPDGSTALHVLYCSLPDGHVGECVWQNPTPTPVIS